jgi:hypothetical protein
MPNIDREHFYFQDAAEYLSLKIGEFRYLVEEGFIRYGIDARGCPFSFVYEGAAEAHFDKSIDLTRKDICHDDFVYFCHSSFRSHADFQTESTAKGDICHIQVFEDFHGERLRIFDISGDGSLNQEDLWSSASTSYKIDDEGLLIGIRFTKEELDRYTNRGVFVEPKQKLQKNLANYLFEKNNTSFEVEQGWFRYTRPSRMRDLNRYLWMGLNMYCDFHGTDGKEINPGELLNFMAECSNLMPKHKHWRFQVHKDKKQTLYSFEPSVSGVIASAGKHDIDAIRQSLQGLMKQSKDN